MARHPEDPHRVRLAAAGDRASFTALYDESVRLAWAFAVRRRRSRAAAEALTGAILRAAFDRLHSYEGREPFAAWLLAIFREADGARVPSRASRGPRPDGLVANP